VSPQNRQIPALILKIGHYPLHSGGVGAIRTLGRLGVPVYATAEDRLTPAAVSRYCTGTFRWRTTGHEDPADLVGGLAEIGQRIGRKAVAVPVDDEAAVLLAEHADVLSEYFLFPRMADPGLVRKLASKHELSALCQEHGFPVPAWAFAATGEEVAAFAATARFPVVVKNAAPWVRRRAPAVAGTTVVGSAAELIELASSTRETPALLLQEYIPHQVAEDWIVHLYCDADANCRVLFTGVKTGSWPPNTGATASGIAVPNPALSHQVERFCKAVGFHGIADLDVRFDRRDQQYKLVDFNPRMGNQFRLFETPAGIDVIRAQYLDLTGEPVPPGDQINGRRIVVEHINRLSRLGERGSGYRTPSAPGHATETELAWLAPDDPLPFLAMLPRFATPAMSYLTGRLFRRRKHT
jgi:predicted ATP-grasp superfamily ATP-dependent carboligase